MFLYWCIVTIFLTFQDKQYVLHGGEYDLGKQTNDEAVTDVIGFVLVGTTLLNIYMLFRSFFKLKDNFLLKYV